MAFEELKMRQSAMWGSGPYQKVHDREWLLVQGVKRSL
jgi:hypothetical protein